MIVQLGLIIIVIAIIVYLQHMVSIYSYWKKRGVIGPKPYPIIGNYLSVIFRMESEGEFLQKIYEQYPNEKFVGIYKGIRPVLVIREPDLMKCVLIKDFDYFTDRCLEKSFRVFKKMVFIMRADARWKATKSTLSPSFTKSKLLKMMPHIQEATDDFFKFIDRNKIEHEMCDLNKKYMIQIIGYLIFGVNLDAFQGSNELRNGMEILIDPLLNTSLIHIVAYICPPIVEMLIPVIHRELDRRVNKTYRKFVTSLIYKPRDKKSVNPIFIETLIDLKESSKIRNGQEILDINDDDVLQHTLNFSVAIYHSMSLQMALMMHELALNQDIQEKCYNEVMTVSKKYNGVISSEALFEMKYLEMTFHETERMHPHGHCLDRKCSSKYTFPDTNLTIDKGIYVFWPIHGLNRDPKYFPNPNVFDPERFSPQNKAKIPPYVFIPFGDGPRKCLGTRLVHIFLFMSIALFLRKYKVTPSAKTKPVRYDPGKEYVTCPLGDLWLNIEPRN